MSDVSVSLPTPAPPPEPVITQDDRTMAVLAHALQVVGGFIAPLVILIMKRDRPFVAFHALQALLLQVLYVLMWVVGMVVWFAVIFGTIARSGGSPQPNAPPPLLFAFFPLLWLGAMALWVAMIVVAVVYSIKAGRGEWARYPLIGGLARKFLNL
jgi:uncharacterized protein